MNPISWIRGVAGGSLKIISLPHQIISIFKIKSLSLKPLLGCASISRNFTCQFKVKSLQLRTQYQQYHCILKFATNIVQSPIIFIELINSIFSGCCFHYFKGWVVSIFSQDILYIFQRGASLRYFHKMGSIFSEDVFSLNIIYIYPIGDFNIHRMGLFNIFIGWIKKVPNFPGYCPPSPPPPSRIVPERGC